MQNSFHSNFPPSDRYLQRLRWERPPACLPPARNYRPFLPILFVWVAVVALACAAVFAFNAGFELYVHAPASHSIIRALGYGAISVASGLLAIAFGRAS